MSTLEFANSKIIGPLLHDLSIPLDKMQQWSIAQWALKTSMVIEAIGNKKQFFYSPSDRQQLRASNIPPNTFIWLGRYVGNRELLNASIHLWSATPDDPKVFHCYVTTIVFGYFAVQVLCYRVPHNHPRVRLSAVNGPWDRALIPVLPTNVATIVWPPSLAFDDVNFVIGNLINRFRPECAEAIP